MLNKNYSEVDGRDLLKKMQNKFKLTRTKDINCSKCNIENNEYSRYCQHCGNSLEEIIELKEREKVSFIKKEEITTSIVAVGILFIMTLILKMVLDINLSPLQIILGLNLGSVAINSNAIIASGIINVKIGLLILLVLPIISLIIANLVVLKKKDANSILHNINGVGITYALLLVLISIFAQKKATSRELIEYGISFRFTYNILRIFINGYIIAAICTYMTGFKQKYKNENIYLNIIDKVMKVIGLGIALILIIITVTTISDSTHLSDIGLYRYSKDFSLTVVMTQLAVYLWAFTNFIPITIGDFQLSSLNILTSDLFFETKLILGSIIALSLLIILITGYTLKDGYRKNDIKPVIIFSVFYALFMGLIALFSKISIDGSASLLGSENYQTAIMMGFPIVSTIIRSFIYSFVVAIIGFKLNNSNE